MNKTKAQQLAEVLFPGLDTYVPGRRAVDVPWRTIAAEVNATIAPVTVSYQSLINWYDTDDADAA